MSCKKCESNDKNEQKHTSTQPHLTAMIITLLIILMLCVLGAGSYFYTLHKIIDNEKLSVLKVDTSSYPKIEITIKADGFNYNLESNSFSVEESDSSPKELSLINEKRDTYILRYSTPHQVPKKSKVAVSIHYQDHNKEIDLTTNYKR